ncbi:MAG: AI-2E family transporter [Halioglobus sp.]
MKEPEIEVLSVEAQLIAAEAEHRKMVRRALYILSTLAVFCALYLSRALLLPIVLALLFSLLLSPQVAWFKRFHIPRPISSVFLVCMLGGPFVVLSIQLAVPAQKWWEQLPELTVQVTQQLTDLGETLSPETPPPPVAAAPQPKKGFDLFGLFAGDEPVAAPVVAPEPPAKSALVEGVKKGGVAVMLSILGAAPFIAAQVAVWLILVLFLMIFGPGVYDNVINLFPVIRDKRRTTVLTGRLRHELSRYILMVTIINAGLGLVTGCALWLLGVEDAMLWGALVGLLNYAPYVGPVIAICMLGIAGIAQYGLDLQALLPAAVYFGINLLESQFVTPTILGQNMRLNPLILILWLLLWGWLWGPVGVLIGVPLLVCLKLVASQLNVLPYWVELVETQS